MVYDDLLGEIAEQDVPSSEFKPPTESRNEYCRLSPVKTRSNSALASAISCNPSSSNSSPDDDHDSGDEFDPSTPSRMPREPRRTAPSASSSLQGVPATSQGSRFNGKSRQYCTQQCLRGLIMGGRLDWRCPNVLDHGVNRHKINPKTLLCLLDEQLSSNDLRPDLELGCESLHIHGTRGALFKVTLWSHGYTFVGKGTPVEFVACAKHEESVYSRLSQIQGVHVPVLLGSLDLRRPFSYDGIADMVHMMFMSYAGRTLAKQHQIDHNRLVQEAENSLKAIHTLGVLHSDPILGNMIWNEENDRVMFIDFERATVQNRRMSLGPISPNQEHKRGVSVWEKSPNKRPNCFEREKQRMRHELRL